MKYTGDNRRVERELERHEARKGDPAFQIWENQYPSRWTRLANGQWLYDSQKGAEVSKSEDLPGSLLSHAVNAASQAKLTLDRVRRLKAEHERVLRLIEGKERSLKQGGQRIAHEIQRRMRLQEENAVLADRVLELKKEARVLRERVSYHKSWWSALGVTAAGIAVFALFHWLAMLVFEV